MRVGTLLSATHQARLKDKSSHSSEKAKPLGENEIERWADFWWLHNHEHSIPPQMRLIFYSD